MVSRGQTVFVSKLGNVVNSLSPDWRQSVTDSDVPEDCLCSARLITCRAAKVGELPLSQTAATRAACKDVVNAAQSLFFWTHHQLLLGEPAEVHEAAAVVYLCCPLLDPR